MSAPHATERLRRRDDSPSRPDSDTPRRDWIGVDFSNFATNQPSRALLPLLVLALIVALGVASLRIDLIRTRYALAAATAEEKRLIEEQRALIFEKLQGRDPVELAVLAEQRGFRPMAPALALVDPEPSIGARRFGLETIGPPAVAAGPPEFGDTLELGSAVR